MKGSELTYTDKLATIAKPTLLLWGAEDQFAPIGGAYRFEKEIPGARLLPIEGAGHFVFDEEPERAVETVCEFVSSLSA